MKNKYGMQKVITIIIVLIISTDIYSQVFGISASKLSVINAKTAVRNQIEFEPGFGYYWANKYYDNNGKLVPLSASSDSTEIFKELVFRFTYGITDKFEAGMMVASDLSSISAGAKYTLFTINSFSGGILAGGTFSNESDIVAINTGIYGKTYSLATGLAFSNEFSEKISLDVDAQYQWLRDDKVSYSRDFFANAELSYIFKNKNQLIGSFSYVNNNHTHKYDGHQNYLLTFNVGTTIETGKSFILVFLFPITLMGKNYDRLTGFSFALTLFFN